MIGTKKNNKIAVYTAIYGDYDFLMEPAKTDPCVDYICFTDNRNLKSRLWRVVYKKGRFADPNRSAKIYKILPHKFLKKYNFVIWVDGNCLLRVSNFKGIVEKYLTNKKVGIAFFKHPERNCVYKEMDACNNLQKDDPEIMERQLKKYLKKKYPSNNGLTANGIIIRDNTDRRIKKLDNFWWKEIKSGSKRDQLSFGYASWKTRTPYYSINQNIWDNEIGSFVSHRK